MEKADKLSVVSPSWDTILSILHPTVLISALGYFVDIYDLLLFGIVRVTSLKDIGLSEKELLDVGILLVNIQMLGMLLGGVLWGIVGDKKGRVSVLFGSILIYSVANLLNAFVTSVTAYAVLRFVAGFGLAGELGAAITLVSETLNKKHRGLGNSAVAGIGILGAFFAGIIGEIFPWRTCYIIGGVMGLLLLVLRLSIFESGMYRSIESQEIKRGHLSMLFQPRERFFKYLRCILVGVPIWFTIGILVTFSPELAKQLQMTGPVSAAKAISFCYLGGSVGNIFCGIFSQFWKSRKKAIFAYLLSLLAFCSLTLSLRGISPQTFYLLCAVLGFGTGYWVIFMTATAEQFGTNLRATVTTTVPNFVRGSVIVLTSAFQWIGASIGLIQSAWVIGLSSIVIALASLFWMKETYHHDLDFAEID